MLTLESNRRRGVLSTLLRSCSATLCWVWLISQFESHVRPENADVWLPGTLAFTLPTKQSANEEKFLLERLSDNHPWCTLQTHVVHLNPGKLSAFVLGQLTRGTNIDISKWVYRVQQIRLLILTCTSTRGSPLNFQPSLKQYTIVDGTFLCILQSTRQLTTTYDFKYQAFLSSIISSRQKSICWTTVPHQR